MAESYTYVDLDASDEHHQPRYHRRHHKTSRHAHLSNTKHSRPSVTIPSYRSTRQFVREIPDEPNQPLIAHQQTKRKPVQSRGADLQRNRDALLDHYKRDGDETDVVDNPSLERSFRSLRDRTRGDNKPRRKAMDSGLFIGDDIEARAAPTKGFPGLKRAKMSRPARARKYGQRLAHQSESILASKVPPGVGLTTLGGIGRPPYTHNSLKRVSNVTYLNYLHPPDSEQPSWKPFSMRTIYTATLAVISFALAGVQEFFLRKSQSLAEQDSGLIQYILNVSKMPTAKSSFSTSSVCNLFGLVPPQLVW